MNYISFTEVAMIDDDSTNEERSEDYTFTEERVEDEVIEADLYEHSRPIVTVESNQSNNIWKYL